MLQLTLQPILRLMLHQTPQPTLLIMSPTTQPMLPTSRGTPAQIQDTMQELSLLRLRPIVLKEASIIV
jgi:hypothetical protein